MPIIGLLELVGDGLVTVQGWAVLDLLFGQIDGDVLLLAIYCDQRIRGNQHLPVREPVSGVCDQITNGPLPVIEVEFFDLAYCAIKTVQFETRKCSGFA
jgi:hypothetical protein